MSRKFPENISDLIDDTLSHMQLRTKELEEAMSYLKDDIRDAQEELGDKQEELTELLELIEDYEEEADNYGIG